MPMPFSAAANSHLRELLDVYEVFGSRGGDYNLVLLCIILSRRILPVVDRSMDEVRLPATGGWSKKAYEECVRLGIGTTNVVFDAREWNNGKWGVIPSVEKWEDGR